MKPLFEKTPHAWAQFVLKDPAALLMDHLQCEMKAASTALSLISKNPEHPNLVQPLMQIAREELEHYQIIHAFVVRRGYTLQKITPSPYMVRLLKRASKGPHRPFLDRLIIAALVEARSCERFRLLEKESTDRELAQLFDELVGQEAAHYNFYLEIAQQYFSQQQVMQRFPHLAKLESAVLADLEPGPALHSGWKNLILQTQSAPAT